MKLDVPLLSIVNVPTLAITSVGCTIVIDGDTASIRDVSIGSSDVRNAAGFAALGIGAPGGSAAKPSPTHHLDA